MNREKGLLSRIRERLFGKKQKIEESLLEEPLQSQENETVQDKAVIDLNEQLKMIQVVNEYVEEFVFPELKRDPSWNKGFALKNEIFVSQGGDASETVYRSNVEVFFQDPTTAERKVEYLVSLVRFAGDEWRVFQVKEVVP